MSCAVLRGDGMQIGIKSREIADLSSIQSLRSLNAYR